MTSPTNSRQSIPGMWAFERMARVATVLFGEMDGGDAGSKDTLVRLAHALLGTSRAHPRRPSGPSPWFYVVSSLHALIILGCLAWPFVAPRRWDGWMALFLVLVATHWVALYGECVLSWAEKALFYKDYAMGTDPLHHWFFDVLTQGQAILVVLVTYAATLVSLTAMAGRNVAWDRGSQSIVTSLQFAPLCEVRTAFSWALTPLRER